MKISVSVHVEVEALEELPDLATLRRFFVQHLDGENYEPRMSVSVRELVVNSPEKEEE